MFPVVPKQMVQCARPRGAVFLAENLSEDLDLGVCGLGPRVQIS